jgi:glycosyltransferase involved in cell wall biosynthesis
MKVSAIISAYFCEEYLEGRIENLKAQTLRPQIVVVAEFESPEYKIADSLWEEPDVMVATAYDQPAPTIYDAWNKGIKAASGDFITNANSDDRLAPYAIQKLARQLDIRPEIGLVYADVDIVESLEGGFDSAWRTGHFRWWEGEDQFEKLKSGLCYLGPQPMWRRSLHDKYGYFDPEFKSAGDLEMWLRLSKNGVRFHHLREVLGIYLRREDQAEQRFSREGIAQSEALTARMRYT